MLAPRRRTEQEEHALRAEDAEYRNQMRCDHKWVTVMENSRVYQWCRFCKVTPFMQQKYEETRYVRFSHRTKNDGSCL